MDQEMKNRWADALGSHSYGQTTGKLRRRDSQGRIGYCCLGVLKDINGADWAEAKTEDEGGTFTVAELSDEREFDTVFYDRHDVAGTLPHERDEHDLITKLSAEALEEWGIHDVVMSRLIGMNDDELSSFQHIAEYIRQTDLTTGEPIRETAQAS